MTTFKFETSDYIKTKIDGKPRKVISKEALERFNTSLLGVGDLRQSATSTDAIAAVFDLEGFTNFCKQIEPQLSVPLFLSEFLSWLMEDVKNEMVNEVAPEGFSVFSPLPFFVKFMGDGILFLWDSSDMSEANRRNVVISLHQVCNHYRNRFLPQVRKKVVEPPAYLRCGIARGTVFSVGNGEDFVGSCINMAARIQKLPGTRFAFNRRGFDLESANIAKFFKERVVIKLVSIRGIGENELIAILKSEFDSLSAEDKERYREP